MFDTRPLWIRRDSEFSPYKIDQSCRFNDDDSAQLTWTPSGAGTEETFTFATWVKRCNLSSVMQLFNAAAGNELQFTASNKLQFTTASATLLTTQVFRDVGSWMHICLAVDTTQAVAADRVNLYINGVEVTAFDTETYPTLNEVTEFNKAAAHTICANEADTEEFDGYLANTYFVDGTQCVATVFGKFKYGIWIPEKYTGTYGTNGFYLDFSNSADFGEDQSGNNNDFTDSGLATNDQVLDTPTNDYCNLNLLDLYGSVLRNGNLESSEASDYHAQGTLGVSSGKWEWEFTANSTTVKVGILPSGEKQYLANPLTSQWYYGDDGNFYVGVTGQGYGAATFTTTDVIRVQLDLDLGTLRFFKNDADQGVAATGLNDGTVWVPYFGSGASGDYSVDFGQLGFTPAAGFKTLCSENLDTPAILNPAVGFDAVLYEGTGAEQSITSLEFQPDLVWIKNRDATDEHKLVDSVRGITKELSSDSTAVEGTDANGLTAFLSNGFTLGTGANGYNDATESFVAWCFKRSAVYGFDIQTYTGTGVAQAISHDLGAAPELMMIKNLDTARNWRIYHHNALNKTDPETDYGILDTTAIWSDASSMWNDTAPTISNFTIGTDVGVNENTDNFIAYLWRSIAGFSKVFSYEGNGNDDGTFINCGFRPRWILLKSADGARNWVVVDTERWTYNIFTTYLFADTTAAETASASYGYDILSNGFKLRHSLNQTNGNSETYVGIAYAEQPGKWSNAR